MCGICGFVELGSAPAERSRLEAMLPPIAHRGPDDSGSWIEGKVALGHRRLSIIDLSERGHQPMVSRDGNFWIILNGEIFNFAELRAALPDPNDYRGTSDTEVLLRAFETWGPECLHRLNGMYAFAIYDRRKKTLFLARDRFGVKPLYWARDDSRFYFGSEIKSFLAGGLEPQLDRVAVIDWVLTGWTSDDRWLLRHVHRLPPGHHGTLNVETREWTCSRYYDVSPHTGNGLPEMLHGRALEDRIEEELVASVKRRMVSDVPVGTYLSGGIDSSLLTALAAREHPKLHAFNVATPDSPKEDESAFANLAARHLGVQLHTCTLTRQNFREHLVDAIHVTEYPLTYANTVPLMLVSKLAREKGVIVLLSGEGADELFGGYVSKFRSNALERILGSFGSLVGGIGRFALRRMDRWYERLGGRRPAPLERPALDRVLSGSLRNYTKGLKSRADYGHYASLDQELAGTLLTQLQTYLLPILHRTDRASMFASIEARTPFLDFKFVELALKVPPTEKLKVRWGRPEGKSVLKRIAARHLPKSVVFRPKMGFSIPFSYYSGEWPKSWLNEGFLTREFGVDPDPLRAWLASLDDQNFFMALAVEIWGHLYVYRRDRKDVQKEFLGVT